MLGKAKEQTEIEEEKEIVRKSTVQAMGQNKYGNVIQNELEDKLDKNAGDGKTEVINNTNTLVVKFIDSERYYEVDGNGNVEILEVIVDKNPGDITKDRDGKDVDGSEKNPYEIWCVEDLVAFSQSVNNGNSYSGLYVSLMRTLDIEAIFSYSNYQTKDYDIYLGGDGNTDLKTQLSSSGNGFITIGYTSNGVYRTFRGTFDGNGNEILNLCGKNSLFGNVSSATIKNLKLSGSIGADTKAGMILVAESSYIINCSNYANISGQTVGGICQNSSSSYFYNCYNVGKISGKWQTGVGGIVGEANEGTTIYNSYNLGEISITDGNSYAASGGIVGYIRTGNITVENCYNLGNISSSKYKGGIIGAFEGETVTINNCYFLENISNGIGNSSGGVSATLEQLMGKELINEQNIVDIFNDFVNQYNSNDNTIVLNGWIIDEKSNYLVFEKIKTNY